MLRRWRGPDRRNRDLPVHPRVDAVIQLHVEVEFAAMVVEEIGQRVVGEDFELLFTLPADEARKLLSDPPFLSPSICQVGNVVGEASGVFRATASGELVSVTPEGFEHQ